MLNLTKDQSNTIYSFFNNYTGVAPFTLTLSSQIDSTESESFVLTLSEFGERVSFSITPTTIAGSYRYEITDTNSKVMESGRAEIEL